MVLDLKTFETGFGNLKQNGKTILKAVEGL